MSKNYLQQIRRLYRTKRIVGPNRSDACKDCLRACRKEGTLIAGPVGPWYVGPKYQERPRLLFVGQWMELGANDFATNRILNLKKAMDFWSPIKENGLLTTQSAFWQFIKQVSERVFPSDFAQDRIAVTNLVKCLRKDKKRTPNNTLIHNCVDRLQIVQEEIKILGPDLVILLTGWFAATQVEEMMGEDRRRVSKKTTTVVSTKKKPKFIWTWHPQSLRRKKLFDLVCDEVVTEIKREIKRLKLRS